MVDITQHSVEVKKNISVIKGLRPDRYRAVCSCGYVGPGFESKTVAEMDGDGHVLIMMRAEE